MCIVQRSTSWALSRKFMANTLMLRAVLEWRWKVNAWLIIAMETLYFSTMRYLSVGEMYIFFITLIFI